MKYNDIGYVDVENSRQILTFGIKISNLNAVFIIRFCYQSWIQNTIDHFGKVIISLLFI